MLSYPADLQQDYMAILASNFWLPRRLGMNRQRRGKARAAGNRKDGANPALNAVLIYENLVAGVRARGFLQ